MIVTDLIYPIRGLVIQVFTITGDVNVAYFVKDNGFCHLFLLCNLTPPLPKLINILRDVL